MAAKPKIIISCGDPNGIGIQIAYKIITNSEVNKLYNLKFIVPESILKHYTNNTKRNLGKKIIPIDDYGYIPKPGYPDAIGGKISGDAIKLGAEMCLNGEADALVTMPISKVALNEGGYKFPGHTEMLQYISGAKATMMIMYSSYYITAMATTHIPLKDVALKITEKYLTERISMLLDILKKDFRYDKPYIAMFGLNPHCGDDGTIGTEDFIIKAVSDKFRKQKMNVYGPYSADGFFVQKSLPKNYVVFAMYHDQALIPFKILSGGKGVNYTAGLPFIRTSPAHGTGFDIVNNKNASISSSLEAIKLASELIKNK